MQLLVQSLLLCAKELCFLLDIGLGLDESLLLNRWGLCIRLKTLCHLSFNLSQVFINIHIRIIKFLLSKFSYLTFLEALFVLK